MNKGSKIFIIGHNGIIDHSLTRYFKTQEYTRVISSAAIALDTTIQPSVYDYFQNERPEYVFLTSVVSGGIEANRKLRADFFYKNCESQNNVIYAAHKFGTRKLLFVGASCVYPREAAQPMKETALLTGPPEETSEAYAIAKIAGIKACEAYRHQHKFNAVSMIPATVYGPGGDTDIQTAHVMGALIGKFVRAVEEKQDEVVVWGSGNPRREFIYCDDFAEAAGFLMKNYDEKETINAGSGSDVSIKELAEIIAGVTGFDGKVTFDYSKPDGTPQKFLDSSRIKKLGFSAKTSLKEGITKTVEWLKCQEAASR